MSVCFFVPAGDQANANDDTLEEGADDGSGDTSQLQLQQFWHNVMEDVKKVAVDDFKTQALPLARIKKIMKLDEDVKMISAEAPILFAKAAEIFIHELTLRAWSHTEDNKRRTLQRNDIAMAISKSDQFDFLIDIVPRHEVKVSQPRNDIPRPMPAADPVPQQHTTATIQHAQPQQYIIQPTQLVQQTTSATPSASTSQQPVTIMQQIVGANGEVQQIPLQLSAQQLNMIRLQVQNNQPVIIQAAQPTQPSPQIIQVQQAQHQPQQQVFITQVANQDDS